MKRSPHSLRLMTLAIVLALPLLVTSGVASAKAKAGCHKTHTCKTGGGGGGGTGGTTPGPMTLQIDPNPLVETGQSEVAAIIQVETSPSLAGDKVIISSSQLASACTGLTEFAQIAAGGNNPATFTLDNDGNVTVFFQGEDCAPGPSVVEASLTEAPFYTALGTLNAEPPVVTTPGVTGYPQTSGTVSGGEVETSPGGQDGESAVAAVFYVETDPVYAEQPVEISSPELQDRCGAFWLFEPPFVGPGTTATFGAGTTIDTTNTTASIDLDNDGNAVFLFLGASCAAGSSVVTADVLAGTHPTYTTTFNIIAPTPTI